MMRRRRREGVGGVEVSGRHAVQVAAHGLDELAELRVLTAHGRHRVAVLHEPFELRVEVGLDGLDMRPEGARDEVVLLGEARGELRGHGSLLQHVEELRQPVDVLADALVVFVTGDWQ